MMLAVFVVVAFAVIVVFICDCRAQVSLQKPAELLHTPYALSGKIDDDDLRQNNAHNRSGDGRCKYD